MSEGDVGRHGRRAVGGVEPPETIPGNSGRGDIPADSPYRLQAGFSRSGQGENVPLPKSSSQSSSGIMMVMTGFSRSSSPK